MTTERENDAVLAEGVDKDKTVSEHSHNVLSVETSVEHPLVVVQEGRISNDDVQEVREAPLADSSSDFKGRITSSMTVEDDVMVNANLEEDIAIPFGGANDNTSAPSFRNVADTIETWNSSDEYEIALQDNPTRQNTTSSADNGRLLHSDASMQNKTVNPTTSRRCANDLEWPHSKDSIPQQSTHSVSFRDVKNVQVFPLENEK